MTFQPVLVGRRVRFTGVALARYAGRTVSIVSDGKTVATGPIRADGTFSLSAPAPPRSRRASTKYEAVSGHLRTRRFRLMRRAYVVKAERGSISGRVRSTRTRRRGARATLFVQVSCTKRRKVATARVTAAGRFRLRLPRSTPGEFAVYQLRVKLRGMTTWTYPVLVRP
jgi:hypothetical protein